MPHLALAPPIEVLLVDDQRSILAGVSALLESDPVHIRVTGQARSGREALRLAHESKPHVIVLDADLGGEDGIALIPALQAACGAAIVLFTGLVVPAAQLRALRLGATAFVPKTGPSGDLVAAILDAVHRAGECDNRHGSKR